MMEFSKHLKQFLLMFVIVAAVLLLYSEYFKMNYMPRDFAIWKGKYELVHRYDAEGTILLGDSRAMAGVIPDEISPDFYNFSLGGSSTVETYYLLKKYLPSGAKAKKVLISFYPERLMFDKSFGKVGANPNFELLNMQDVLDVYSEAKRLGQMEFYDYFNVFDKGNLFIDTILYVKEALWRRTLSLRSSLFFFRRTENRELYQHIIDERGHRWIGIEKCNNEVDPDLIRPHFLPSPLFVYYLDEILKQFEEKKIPVKFISMPINPATNLALSETYRKEYKEFLESLVKRHPGVEYVSDLFPVADPCDFGDALHLNQDGARRWSIYLRDNKLL